jgi:hypothetical protein
MKEHKTMCKPTTDRKGNSTLSASKWLSVPLPILGGLLHFSVALCSSRVTYLAFSGQAFDFSKEELLQCLFRIDALIFLTYSFDILCCKLGVIPFSRCNTSGDIIGHHLPTLLLSLPLNIPVWANIRYLDPTIHSILDLEIGHTIRNNLIGSFLIGSSLPYVSSLNEVFMCFQRAEMNFQGIGTFRDIPEMTIRIFSSRQIIGVELCFKLLVFWFFSIIIYGACFVIDKSLYDFIIMSSATTGDDVKPLWKILFTIYTSPGDLRSVIGRVFFAVMYPSMGARCLKKIKVWIREGKSQHQKIG